MRKRNLLTFVLASSALLLTACRGNETTNEIEKIEISCTGNVTSLSVGSTLQFSAKVLPESAEQKVTWSVVDIKGDAEINESGLLTAVREGMVEVVAASYADPETKSTYALNITKAEEVKPTAITLTADATTINIGKKANLTVEVTPSNASVDVTFTSSNTDVATVSNKGVVLGIAKGEATIEATSKLDTTVKATIKITVNEELIEETIDWSKVPVSTHDEYMAAKKDTPLKVEGKCTHITPTAEGTYDAWLTNGAGGFYLYGLSASQTLELNKTYEVCGKKAYYTGTNELKDIEKITPIDKTIDITETDITTRDFKTVDAFKDVMGGKVVVNKAIIITNPVEDAKDFNVTVQVNGLETTLRYDPTLVSEETGAAIVEKFKTIKAGQAISYKGIANSYGYGTPKFQVYVVDANDIQVVKLTDDEQLGLAKNALKIGVSIKKDQNSIALPSTIDGFDGVQITWSDSTGVIGADGNLIKRPEVTTNVKLTATLKLNAATTTKDFTVTVYGDEVYQTVHTFDVEDASHEVSNGCSATKPKYTVTASDEVELGSPAATWNLRNTLIGCDTGDVRSGDFSMRSQINSDPTKTGRIELRQDFEFTTVEFDFATFNKDTLGAGVVVSYSIDSGKTWKDIDVVYHVNTNTLETIRVLLPESSATTRVAFTLQDGIGKRVNFDNIKLLKL